MKCKEPWEEPYPRTSDGTKTTSETKVMLMIDDSLGSTLSSDVRTYPAMSPGIEDGRQGKLNVVLKILPCV